VQHVCTQQEPMAVATERSMPMHRKKYFTHVLSALPQISDIFQHALALLSFHQPWAW